MSYSKTSFVGIEDEMSTLLVLVSIHRGVRRVGLEQVQLAWNWHAIDHVVAHEE